MSYAMSPSNRFFSATSAQLLPNTGRSFGRRVTPHPLGRIVSVDRNVADMRRRIDQSSSGLSDRLPIAIGGLVTVTVSGALWAGLWSIAHTMAETLGTIM